MIPKKIHYCWFGGNPLPEKDQKCIDSWKEKCPDYEIIRWDESNYDINKNLYMKQAYEAKKWGFVPDFARLDIIYNEGGVYLDTDVELLKNLDELLKNDAYMGTEEGGTYINPGLGFGAAKNHPGIKDLMDIYKNRSFIKEDGTLDTVASPIMNTERLQMHGFVPNNKVQVVNGITIYPSDYLAPKDYQTQKLHLTENSVSIHHYNASWFSKSKKINRKIIAIIGKKNFYRLVKIKNIILRK